jgi:hypothetical protein
MVTTGRVSVMTVQDPGKANGQLAKRGPEISRVVPTTKVNVAFPFSQIKIQEPAEHVRALASLVAELAALVAATAPGQKAEELKRRAHDLAGRLG